MYQIQYNTLNYYNFVVFVQLMICSMLQQCTTKKTTLILFFSEFQLYTQRNYFSFKISNYILPYSIYCQFLQGMYVFIYAFVSTQVIYLNIFIIPIQLDTHWVSVVLLGRSTLSILLAAYILCTFRHLYICKYAFISYVLAIFTQVCMLPCTV